MLLRLADSPQARYDSYEFDGLLEHLLFREREYQDVLTTRHQTWDDFADWVTGVLDTSPPNVGYADDILTSAPQ